MDDEGEEGGDRNKEANEIVRSLVGDRRRHCRLLWQQVKTVERHESEASNTKREHEICRHFEESRVLFTSSAQLANHFSINEIGEVGKLVTKIEMDAPEIGKLE